MKKSLFCLGMLILTASGCVSIATHEKMRKQCRQVSEEAESLRVQNKELEENATRLEEKLSESTENREDLEKKISEIRSTYDELVESLKNDIAHGDVGVAGGEGKLTITMGNKVLFRSGSDRLQKKGRAILSTVSKSLKKVTGAMIQVEGHTDNIPISGSLKNQFPSNWDLSAARASTVVRYLQEQGGVSPEKLVLTAYADQRPVADNQTAGGREQNRRVEITLIPLPQ